MASFKAYTIDLLPHQPPVDLNWNVQAETEIEKA
jgi:hypothetical protein